MSGFLELLKSIFGALLNMNSAVLVPIFLLIIAMIMGAKFSKAMRSALTVGVGFVGIACLTDLFFTVLAGPAEAMVENWGLSLNIIDVGWGPLMSAIWALPIALLMLPLFFVVNLILIFVKFTDTMDIDLWNYALCFYGGMYVYTASGHNFVLSLLAFVVSEIIVLKAADLIAPKTEEFFGLPGLSFPHVVSISFMPIGWALSKVLDKIPGIKDLNADPETLRKKFGVFGEPAFMGFAIGTVIGLLAGDAVSAALYVGIAMAAVMILLPRMVSVLVEGLTPLSEIIRDRIQKWLPGREIRIGMDTAITIGHPATLAASVLLVPIALVLAAVLPYNHTIPFADLASIAFMLCLITPYVKGNVVKLVIIGTLIIAFVMLPVSTLTGPLVTDIVKEAGMFSIPEGFGSATMVTSFLDGANPISFMVYKVFSLFF
ncbi:MAG: PTS galactitol transporter subunit IIC [Dorea sp.]|nr:PTS galactitol transporter subunit IIC [Dorea sp.]